MPGVRDICDIGPDPNIALLYCLRLKQVSYLVPAVEKDLGAFWRGGSECEARPDMFNSPQGLAGLRRELLAEEGIQVVGSLTAKLAIRGQTGKDPEIFQRGLSRWRWSI